MSENEAWEEEDFFSVPIEEDADEDQELFEHFKIVADKKQVILRVDKFLQNRIENTSRSKIQAAADAGNIHANGNPVKSNYKVKPGDVIAVVFSFPPRDKELKPEDIPINIIYEDEDICMVNKNPGMVVHPGFGNYKGTLVNALLYHFQHLSLFQQNTPRPGLVHRIDKNTSGIMVVAKTEFSLSHLARQFFERTSKRTYIALVWGDVKLDEGTITGHIGRDLKERKLFTVFPNGDNGRHAVTHYKVLQRFGYVTLIQCKLETGRTHQIRVHMKYIGHPLFNDDTYGGNKVLKGTTFQSYRQFIENCFKIIPRHALHAKSLGFLHPTKNIDMMFDSELPKDFVEVLKKWETYYSARLEGKELNDE